MNNHFSTDAETSTLLATFEVGENNFGLDTTSVQEVVLLGNITPVHHAPDYVSGIINLRGKIVTVIDLGIKLNAPDETNGDENRIMIVPWREEFVGLLVDRVGDVLAVEARQIEPVPANVEDSQKKYLQGIYRNGSQVVGIIDINAVLGEY